MDACFAGPRTPHAAHCEVFDVDVDGDIGLQDFAGFQRVCDVSGP